MRRQPRPNRPLRQRLRSRLALALRGAPAPPIGMDVCLSGLAARGFVPRTVLDVGAAAGTWTRLAMGHWPDANYLLIEPLEERRATLEELNRESGVELVLAAAGEHPGRATLNITPDLFGSSVMYPGVEAREVPMVTLDGLLDERSLPAVDLIKLDVQGYELRVLAGGSQALAHAQLVLMEVRLTRIDPEMPLLHEAVDWMLARGFRLYEIADVARRPLDGAMAQADLLFAREGIPLLATEGWI